MESGLVSALSGALAQNRRIETVANNLANADAPAFKERDLVFEETLAAAHQEDSRDGVMPRPYTESELASKAGTESRNVLHGASFTNFKPGAFRPTHNSLDVAIEGNGFLEVLTPQGIRLTRAGNLALDSEGRIVNRDGFLVLGAGAGGANILQQDQNPALMTGRALRVGTSRVQIDLDGSVYAMGNGEDGPQQIGRLSLVQVENPDALKHEGGQMFSAGAEAFLKTPEEAVGRNPAGVQFANEQGAAAKQPRPNPLGPTNVRPRVQQGMLESSNVNPVEQMTRMIEAHRLFEQNIKVMQGVGEFNARAAELGKF